MPSRGSRRRRGIKLHRNYSIGDVARLLGVARGTVRRWIATSLPALRDQKPTLILGGDLIEFLSAGKTHRQKCLPHECFCVKCRAPRAPEGGMVEFVPLTPTNGNMRALCPTCGTVMYKRVRRDALPFLRLTLDVTFAQARPSIGGSYEPSEDVNLRKDETSRAATPPSK